MVLTQSFSCLNLSSWVFPSVLACWGRDALSFQLYVQSVGSYNRSLGLDTSENTDKYKGQIALYTETQQLEKYEGSHTVH